MKPEIFNRSKEGWFSPNLPLPEQSRLVVGTFDLDIERLGSLRDKLKSAGLDLWNVPEGAYSTIYFWSPIDEDLATRIRARWYREPVELENLATNMIFVNPNQLASLEIKVTFLTEQGEEYETKYRQRARLSKIMEVSKNLQMATNILNSTGESTLKTFSISEIPKEVFAAISRRHPYGFVPTVMVSAMREHFIADFNHPDNLRVTIDHNYKYYSFWGTSAWAASYIGGYLYARIEIKVEEDKLTEKAKEAINIVRQEGGFLPKVQKHADQTFINHKYSINRFPLVLK